MSPIAIMCSSLFFGLIGVVFLALIVPWVDFVITKLHINPFRYTLMYFEWCEKKQKQLRGEH